MVSCGKTIPDQVQGDDDVYLVASSRDDQRDQHPVVTMPIGSLRPSDSPRLAGENADHVHVLAELGVTLPPIIVNRSTRCVIDGMHRLRAAILRGQNEIEVQLFEGDEKDAFILAVKANIEHGLPLSLADRTVAAARIISSHPQWSDRAIASSTGLSAKTVSAVRRRCSTAENPQLNTRIGRDGRIRPLNAAEGRRIAGELMADNPSASLREISNVAGISLGTAQNVRERLRRSQDPLSPKQQEGVRRRKPRDLPIQRGSKMIDRTSVEDRSLALRNLCRDPSLRLTNPGRFLIRLLHPLAVDTEEWKRLIDNLPKHCTSTVSDAARACAVVWQEFASQLERR